MADPLGRSTLPAKTIDVVISNCVINLAVAKPAELTTIKITPATKSPTASTP